MSSHHPGHLEPSDDHANIASRLAAEQIASEQKDGETQLTRGSARSPFDPPGVDTDQPPSPPSTISAEVGAFPLAGVAAYPPSPGDTIEQAPHDARKSASLSRGQAPAPAAFPGYEILGELGRGGMGVVYKARHVQLNRPVAIKVLLSGQYADAISQARFLVEAEAVAKVQHPNVVQVFEYGQHDGQPFFALEFVGGGTLAAKLAAIGRFTPRDAAAMVAKLAEAIAAAHAKGIVHRDLKPANVMLDEAGEPKVTDFGLAKVGESDLTATGAIMGTPSYMSPEQAAGRTKEVGTATDVYTLGAILYELLTGRTPFKGDTVMDTIQQVQHREPQRPRAIVATTPRDLETICLKCLEKDYRRRYATAESLATDLQAYIAGEPIAARPVGGGERAWKWARRNPVVASLVTAVALVSVVGTGLVVWQWQVAVDQARIANEQTAVAATERDQKELALQDATHQRNAAQAAEAEVRRERDAVAAARAVAERQRDVAREALHQLEAAQYVRLVADARRSLRDRRPDVARESLFQTAEGPRGWEWHHTLRTLDAGRPQRLYGTEHHLDRLVFSPDGRYLVTPGSGLEPGAVWDTRAATRLFPLTGMRSGGDFRFSVDGRQVVALSTVLADGGNRRENAVKGWNVPGGELAFTYQFGDAEGRVVDFAAGADGPLAVAEPRGGKGAVVWDARTGKTVATLDGARTAGYAAVSPDGSLVAVGNSPKESMVELRDSRTGAVKATLGPFPHWVLKPAFSPGGSRVALVTNSQARPMQLSVFDTDGKLLARVEEPSGAAFEQLGFSRTGDRLAFVVWQNRYKPGARAEVRVLDVGTGLMALRQEVDPARFVGVAIDAAGTRAAVALSDAISGRVEVRVTDVTTRKELFSVATPTGRVGGLAFTPDGSRLACVYAPHEPGRSPPGTVLLWDVTRQPGELSPAVFAGHRSPVRSVASNPSGVRVAAGAGDGSVRVWATGGGGGDGGDPTVYADHTRAVTGLTFHQGGTRFASAAEDGVKVWEAGRAQPLRTLAIGGHAPVGVAYHPDGRTLVSSGRDGSVRIWDADGGRHLAALAWEGAGKPAVGFEAVAYSPKGDVVAAGTSRGEESPDAAPVVLWDAATRKEIRRLAGHRGVVTALAFTPDGGRIVTGGTDRAIKLWDASTGKLLRIMTGHTGAVTGVTVADGGRRVFSASKDRSVRVWDLGTGQEVAAIDAGAPSGGVALAGGFLLAGAGATVLSWDGTPGREVFALPAQPGGVLALGIQPDGAALAVSSANQLDPASHRMVEPGQLAVWDLDPVRGRYAVGNAEADHRSPVAFDPAGRLAFSVWDTTRRERRVAVLDPAGEVVSTSPPLRGQGTDSADVHAVKFSPNGRVMAVGGGAFDFRKPGAVELRDATTGKTFRRLEGVAGPVTSLAFSPDGTLLAGGSDDFTVAVWDTQLLPTELAKGKGVPVGMPARVLTGHQTRVKAVAFTPDGNRVAAGASNGAIRVWDARSGEELPVAFAGHTGAVSSLAFSPDGQSLASGGHDGVVSVWNAEKGTQVVRITGHDDRVTAVVYSPDGTRLYSAGMDRFVRGWDARPPK